MELRSGLGEAALGERDHRIVFESKEMGEEPRPALRLRQGQQGLQHVHRPRPEPSQGLDGQHAGFPVLVADGGEEGLLRLRVSQQPESDPKYMGVPALLLSEVYGLRSILPPATMALLDEKRRLAAKPELTEEDRQRLQQLDEKLEEADLLAENRDPMYRDFVLAYARLQHERGLDKPVLSPEEREELHQLALSILRAQLQEGEAK